MFKNSGVKMDRIYRNHTITNFFTVKTLKPTTVYAAEET